MKICSAVLIAAFLVFGCRHEHVGVRDDSATSQLLFSGVWKIVSLSVSGQPQKEYTGFQLDFLRNGNLKIIDNANLHIGGQWNVTTLDATDDTPSFDFSLTLAVNRQSSVALISRNWQILHESEKEIVLGNCANGTLDSLVIQRE